MKGLLKVLVVLVLVLGGALVALSFVDLGRFAPQIEQAAKEATGRELKISGPLHIGVSLVPTVVAENVSFANADWGSRPNMLTAKKLGIQVALLPLLSGKIDARSVEIDGADIYLETNRKGVGNWELSTGAAPEPAKPEDNSGGPSLASIPDVKITDLAITYRDGVTGKVNEASFDEVRLDPGFNSTDVRVKGEVNGTEISFDSVVSGDASDLSLKDTALTIGDTSVSGDLSLKRGANKRLTLKGAFTSPELDVTPLLKGGKTGSSGGKSGGKLFSSDPLPFDALETVDVDLDLSIDKLVYGGVTLTDFKAPLKIGNGKLDLPLSVRYRDRPITADIGVNGKAKSMSLDAKSSALDFGRLLSDADVTDLLSAKADFGAELRGRGASLHAIAASANGQTNFALGEGSINSRAFAMVSDDLVNVLIPNGEKGDRAKLVCALSRFDFKKGVGTSKALALETDSLVTTGSGTVNLGSEYVDLLLKPKPKNPSLVSLAFPVRLSGPLASPSAGLDRTGVVTGVATAVAGTALTGGVGALLPLMSTGDQSVASSGGCAALAATAAKDGGMTGLVKGVGETVGGAAKGAAEGVGGALEDVGKGIGNLFGK